MRTKSNSQSLMKHQLRILTAKKLHHRPLRHLLPHLRLKRLLLKRPQRRSKTLQLLSQLLRQRMLSLPQLRVKVSKRPNPSNHLRKIDFNKSFT